MLRGNLIMLRATCKNTAFFEECGRLPRKGGKMQSRYG